MPTTSVFDGTQPVELGSRETGDSGNSSTNILWAQLKDGIDGTRLFYVDFRPIASIGNSSVSTVTGEVWTLNGDAEIENYITQSRTVNVPNPRASNVESYDDDGANKPVSGVIGIGQGEGNDQIDTYVSNTFGSFPLWESVISAKDEPDVTNLTALVDQCLTERSDIKQQFELEITRGMDPLPDDIEVGNMARVVIDDIFQEFDGSMMVGRKRTTLSKEQDERLTLEVTE